jgi:hypothetical protein
MILSGTAAKAILGGLVVIGSLCSVAVLGLLVVGGVCGGNHSEGNGVPGGTHTVQVVVRGMEPNAPGHLQDETGPLQDLRASVHHGEWRPLSCRDLPEDWRNDPCVTTTAIGRQLRIHERKGEIMFEKLGRGPNSVVELFEIRIPLDDGDG